MEVRDGFLLCRNRFLEELLNRSKMVTIVRSCELIDYWNLVEALNSVIKERIGDFRV